MKLNFLGGIFARLFKNPKVQAYLQRTPYGHLYNKGDLYMARWSVVARGTLASKVLLALTGYDHVRLHWIRQPDRDRELHNHPFKYRTFVLRGWYAEQRPGVGATVNQTGSSVTGEGYHRIATVSPDGVWTLFFMGKDKGEWGFLVDGKHMPSREFFELRNIHSSGKAA